MKLSITVAVFLIVQTLTCQVFASYQIGPNSVVSSLPQGYENYSPATETYIVATSSDGKYMGLYNQRTGLWAYGQGQFVANATTGPTWYISADGNCGPTYYRHYVLHCRNGYYNGLASHGYVDPTPENCYKFDMAGAFRAARAANQAGFCGGGCVVETLCN